MDFIIKKMRLELTEIDGTITGGLEETTEKPDTLSVYMTQNGFDTHLFDMIPDKETDDLVVQWIVQTLNYNSDDLEAITRTCCGFMDPVGMEHDKDEHRDIFECPRCKGTESGDWELCNCVKDGPEYRAEEDKNKGNPDDRILGIPPLF